MKVRCLFSLLVLLIMVSCSTTDEKLQSMIPEDAVGVVRQSSAIKSRDDQERQ